MKVVKPTYDSPLRREQAAGTRERILDATGALLGENGYTDSITYRAVAEKAGVTEMTVYRHFPSRNDLLRGLWEWMNRRAGPSIGMPLDEAQLTGNLAPLFEGFDRIPAQIQAGILTPQGREMRESLDAERRAAFLKAVDGSVPGLDADGRRRAAAVFQLLHSAYAWLSFREQWGMNGTEAAEASAWAIRTLLEDLRRAGPAGKTSQTASRKKKTRR